MSLVEWIKAHDRGFASLRRAGRTAIVMPGMFALGDKVIGNPVIATFAAFGSFALLLLVDYTGPIRDRVQAQAALGLFGGIFVCLGTLAERTVWLAVVAMVLVGFCVLFSGVVSSVLAGSSTSLLLAFILPVTFAGPLSSIPDRLAGWGMATGASLVAITVLWPAPTRDPLRTSAITALEALAIRLRSDVAYLLGGEDAPTAEEHDAAVAIADGAVGALHRTFLATPYRPTGLGTAARSVVRLVDELNWLNAIVAKAAHHPVGILANPTACSVRSVAADVLETGADVLNAHGGPSDRLERARQDLRDALDATERRATAELPISEFASTAATESGERIEEFISGLDPSFRAQELTFAASQIGANIEAAAAAERRSWIDRFLGHQPEGLPGTLSAAHERAAAHVERHSVWLHNSVRGATGLGAAVLIANLTGVQHSFWVVLGTLSVLRSNALNTGQNAVRGMLGTVAGVVVGGGLVVLIGTNTTLLWFLLPPAVLIAGFAPAAISFAAGQAAFTVALVILYNIVQPAGWRLGLVRIEDIAIGGGVSILVGGLIWPRGAAAALGGALAEAYNDGAIYLSSAVAFGMARCDGAMPFLPVPAVQATNAAAASRRLDDTFRSYLAERGSKPAPLAAVTGLVNGTAALRLAGDAVLDLWQRDNSSDGDRAGARREILASSDHLTGWYGEFAGSLTGACDVPAPLDHDLGADARLLDAVGHDLRSEDGKGTSTAVRMIWTSDHLDAVRRLQTTLVGPATSAAEARALTSAPFGRRTHNRVGRPTPDPADQRV